MARQVRCECGYVVRAATDDEVVAKTRDHLRSDHPELLDKVSDDDIRGWIEIVA
jgi:predicted small metal-binding protein